VLVLDGKTLVYDRPFSHDGINYPANWLRLTTLAEKEAIGIEEVPDPVVPTYDPRFYWGPGLPKDLDDLKPLWVKNTKETANNLLKPSDWYAIRKADTNEAMPAAWSDWRQSIREAAEAKVAMIELQTDVDSLAGYITISTGAESDYSFWPADPDQPVVEPPEEEVDPEFGVEPPVDGITSAGEVVSGGLSDGSGDDVVTF
jgi:hypothetical protein